MERNIRIVKRNIRIVKKNYIQIIDIITIMLIILYLQSLAAFIIEEYDVLHVYDFSSYIVSPDSYGAMKLILQLGYRDLYFWFSFVVYILNILIIIKKIKKIIHIKAFFKNSKDYFIITNLLFVFLKTCEYYIFLMYALRG